MEGGEPNQNPNPNPNVGHDDEAAAAFEDFDWPVNVEPVDDDPVLEALRNEPFLLELAHMVFPDDEEDAGVQGGQVFAAGVGNEGNLAGGEDGAAVQGGQEFAADVVNEGNLAGGEDGAAVQGNQEFAADVGNEGNLAGGEDGAAVQGNQEFAAEVGNEGNFAGGEDGENDDNLIFDFAGIFNNDDQPEHIVYQPQLNDEQPMPIVEVHQQGPPTYHERLESAFRNMANGVLLHPDVMNPLNNQDHTLPENEPRLDDFMVTIEALQIPLPHDLMEHMEQIRLNILRAFKWSRKDFLTAFQYEMFRLGGTRAERDSFDHVIAGLPEEPTNQWPMIFEGGLDFAALQHDHPEQFALLMQQRNSMAGVRDALGLSGDDIGTFQGEHLAATDGTCTLRESWAIVRGYSRQIERPGRNINWVLIRDEDMPGSARTSAAIRAWFKRIAGKADKGLIPLCVIEREVNRLALSVRNRRMEFLANQAAAGAAQAAAGAAQAAAGAAQAAAGAAQAAAGAAQAAD